MSSTDRFSDIGEAVPGRIFELVRIPKLGHLLRAPFIYTSLFTVGSISVIWIQYTDETPPPKNSSCIRLLHDVKGDKNVEEKCHPGSLCYRRE